MRFLCTGDFDCGDGFSLGALNAFGHHGTCDSWNACGCGAATRFVDGVCDPALGLAYNLFHNLPGPLDDAWSNVGGGGNTPVADDVHCSLPADGSVFDDGWENNARLGFAGGGVICRQLGFAGALEVDSDGGPEGAGIIWLDEVPAPAWRRR